MAAIFIPDLRLMVVDYDLTRQQHCGWYYPHKYWPQIYLSTDPRCDMNEVMVHEVGHHICYYELGEDLGEACATWAGNSVVPFVQRVHSERKDLLRSLSISSGWDESTFGEGVTH